MILLSMMNVSRVGLPCHIVPDFHIRRFGSSM